MNGFLILQNYFSMNYQRKVNFDANSILAVNILLISHNLFFFSGNNPIYNLLPDILGKLSNQDLKQESFFNIMQFLIGSIKKVDSTRLLCINEVLLSQPLTWIFLKYSG